jgi:hypothetical protein
VQYSVDFRNKSYEAIDVHMWLVAGGETHMHGLVAARYLGVINKLRINRNEDL